MGGEITLRQAEPREILRTAIEEKVPAIMTYFSGHKWHVAKVLLTNLGANRLDIDILPWKKLHPENIRVNQPVGISLKYRYGKLVFDTTVVDIESASGEPGPTAVLAVPDRIEIVQRRSYFRVDVPKSLKVSVLLWHRLNKRKANAVKEPHFVKRRQNGNLNLESNYESQNTRREHTYWQGRLADISAGGAQIVVDAAEEPHFRKGQFIGLTFTPMPYEKPLKLEAQIRTILPTADGKSICLGVQIVGLEASSEGRQVLQRLCNVVERYYQINQSSAKQQEMRGLPFCQDPHFERSQNAIKGVLGNP